MTEQELLSRAKEAVGNWMKFECFVWYHSDQPKDAENWTVIHTRNRDSEAIDRANARAIESEMESFCHLKSPTAQIGRFNHWAVGWVDYLAIKVFKRDGQPTKAFRKLCELEDRIKDYPVLDEQLLAEEEAEDAEV